MAAESRRVLLGHSAQMMIWCIFFLSMFSPTGPMKTSMHIQHRAMTENRQVPSSANVKYETRYFTQKVDHFSFTKKDEFQQRYLYADQYWVRDTGPIFFYTGNEGDIAWFCNNTGFMWDIAEEFKALLVFAEHRYYGESLPYGKESYKDPAHLGYLTSEQALADFAVLITHLKSVVLGGVTTPVVAFGGSYGGMLAAWMRMKYPNIIKGALAASAPVWWFKDLTPCGAFYKTVTDDFAMSGPQCAENIKRSWKIITDMGATAPGRSQLSRTLRLCQPISNATQVTALKGGLQSCWSYLAMVDYPYPANFIYPLPAWPIKAVCTHLSGPLTDAQLLEGLAKALNVYLNYTGQVQCFDLGHSATPSLGDTGWSFQACTEMVMPLCTDGVQDMFEPSPWNLTSVINDCQKTWKVTPRPDWVLVQYGGKDIQAASNIIFSNGKLDPWSPGGVHQSLAPTLVVIEIEDAAHHLDLRSANKDDPQSVIDARIKEKDIIKSWLREDTVQAQAVHAVGQSDSPFLGVVYAVPKSHVVWTVVVSMMGTVVLILAALIICTKFRRQTRATSTSTEEKAPLIPN